MKTRLVSVAVALVTASTAVAATGADVTLRVEPHFDAQWKRDRLRFSGTIASRQAGEYVAVTGRLCGEQHFTSAAGATTTAGGAWQVVTERSVLTIYIPATYQARWNDRVSESVTVRPRIPVTVTRLRRGSYRVVVAAYMTAPVLRARGIELQRLTGGQWKRVRTARVTGGRLEYPNRTYSATLAIGARDATLRVVVPAKTAGPCYVAGASKEFRT